MMDFDLWDFRHRRHEVVGKRAGQYVAAVVVNHLFVERVGDALGDAAMDLPVDNHGIDQTPGILDDHEPFDRDLAGSDIDLDNRNVAGVREGAVRVVGRHRRQTGFGDRRKAVALVIGGARELAYLDAEIGAAHEGAAIGNLDVRGGRLQYLAGDRLQALAQCRRGELAGAAGDHQRAAGESAPAVGAAVGVAGDDPDRRGDDADLVSDQLRQTRLQPLAVRRTADPGFEKARRVHRQFDPLEAGGDHHAPRREGGTAGAGALGEHRYPETEPASIGSRRLLSRPELGEVDDPRRRLHCFAIAAGVLHNPGHRSVREVGGQVAAPDCKHIQPEPGGCAIHQPLHRRGDDRPRHAAIGRHRAGVAGDAAGPGAVLGHPIGTGHVRQRHQRLNPAGGREIRIGADIALDIGVDREQAAVRIECAAQMNTLVARVKRRG